MRSPDMISDVRLFLCFLKSCVKKYIFNKIFIKKPQKQVFFVEFYPKGHNLERVFEKALKKNPALINAGPEKVLHYQNLLIYLRRYRAELARQVRRRIFWQIA